MILQNSIEMLVLTLKNINKNESQVLLSSDIVSEPLSSRLIGSFWMGAILIGCYHRVVYFFIRL